MRVPIVVPRALGSGEEPLRLCGWLVDEGDLVLAGDLVAEVLIPGCHEVEIVAESTGRLAEIVKPIDSVVLVGEVICWLEDGTTDDMLSVATEAT